MMARSLAAYASIHVQSIYSCIGPCQRSGEQTGQIPCPRQDRTSQNQAALSAPTLPGVPLPLEQWDPLIAPGTPLTRWACDVTMK